MATRNGVVAGLLLALGTSISSAQEFDFTFVAPDSIACLAGEAVRFEAGVQIATRGVAAGEPGAEAWSMGIAVDAGEIVAIATSGTASERLSNDGTPSDQPSFAYSEIVPGGAVLAVILDTTGNPPASLDAAESPHTVAIVSVDVSVPPADCFTSELRFVDGLRGRGQRVENVVTYDTRNVSPTRFAHSVEVCAAEDSSCAGAALPVDSSPRIVEIVLTPDRPSALVPFAFEAGRPALVLLEDLTPDSSNLSSVYFRWGRPPTRFDHDRASTARTANQRIFIPSARGDTGYVLVEAVRLGGAASPFRLTVEQRDVLIDEITPRVASPRGRVSIAVAGAGFSERTRFYLEDSATGERPPLLGREFLSSELARFDVDLSRAPVGAAHRLVATEPTMVVSDALRVISARDDHGLDVSLAGPDLYRALFPNVLQARFENLSGASVPAPLLKIVVPADVSLRTESDAEAQSGELHLLAVDDDATIGTLDATRSGERALVVESASCPGICPAEFQVFLFTPTANDIVEWNELEESVPAGMTPEGWNAALGRLPEILGPTWASAHERLAEISTRLHSRGQTSSFADAFRLAVRTALGRPSAAIQGVVRESSDWTPAAGVTVVALEDGTIRSESVTGPDGEFVLDWLDHDSTYDVQVLERGGAASSVTVPLETDVIGARLLVTGAAAKSFPKSLNAAPDGLPEDAPAPPNELFTRAHVRPVDIIGPIDPNEKQGPKGDGDDGFLLESSEIFYTIEFENECTDCGPARTVTIVDVLPEALDIESVRFEAIQFTGRTIALGTDAYSVEETRRVSFDWRDRLWTPLVSAKADIDFEARTLTWNLTTLDDDPIAGLLPPNDESRLGQGLVTFSVWTAALATEDDDVPFENRATVIFDGDEENAITTNAWANVVTTTLEPPPPSNPIPASGVERSVPLDAVLSWQGSRKVNDYDLYLWRNGERPPDLDQDPPFAAALERPGYRATELLPDEIYHWRVVARNSAFTVAGPEWTFRTAAPPPACPEPPGGLSPAGRALTGDQPTLRWNASPASDAYTVLLSSSLDGPIDVSIATGLDATVHRLSEPLAPGAYRWQVVALRSECETIDGGTRSAVAEFVVAATAVFLRGDANSDADVNIADPIFTLNGLFGDGGPSRCREAEDANADAEVNIADPIYLLNRLFGSGAPPPPPFPACGSAPAGLGCEVSPCR